MRSVPSGRPVQPSVPKPASSRPPSSVTWAMNPANESSAPADTAPAGVAPDRWKKRMLVATRAAVDGTARLMKLVANWRRVTRPRGTGVGDAVWSEAACATRGTWPNPSARRSSHASASSTEVWMVSQPMSASWEIRR